MGHILKFRLHPLSSTGTASDEFYRPSQSLRLQYSKMTALLRTLDAVTVYIFFSLSVLLNEQSVTHEYTGISVIALFVFLFIAEYAELYSEWNPLSLRKKLQQVSIIWGYTVALVALISAGLMPLYESHSLIQILIWLFLSPSLILILYGYRHLAYSLQVGKERQRNLNIAIVGASDIANRFVEYLSNRPGFEYKSIKYYDEHLAGGASGKPQGLLKNSKANRYESLEALHADAKSGQIDVVYITFPLYAEGHIKETIAKLSDSTASVFIVPDFFSFKLLDGRLSNIQGLPLISVFDSPFQPIEDILKRGFDLFFSTLALIFFAIPMIAICIAVKLTSPGPILFRQKRYGVHGEEIEVWKFRSMTISNNDVNIFQVIKNDPRVTFVGSILRQTSMDELPQFINVLMGSMSIVGPRPHAVMHNEYYREKIKGYMLRHKVKPGITGLAQINGFRGETNTLDKMEGRIRYDLEYIQTWSLMMDLKIMLLTPFKGFTGRAVY